MAVHCDICGIEALESQEFQVERIPFRRAKRYCPACLRKLYFRVYAIMAVAMILMGIGGVVEAWRAGKSVLQSIPLRCACLVLLQWLMVLPHELGHALVARYLGYKQIRILVGFGKPIFSLNLFGFRWLFNLIPLGGLTLPALGTKIQRWRHFAVIAAGPIVNLLAAGLALVFASPGWARYGLRTWPGLFFWANVVVLAENLLPQVAQTQFGAAGTDGYQLWHLLFRWKKPIPAEPEKVPFWELVLCHGLKWLVLLITSATCLLLGYFAVYVLLWPIGSEGHKSGTVLSFVLGGLSLLCGWITVRIVRNPVATVRARNPFSVKRLSFTTEQIELIKSGNEQFARKDFASAEKAFDNVLGLIPERNSQQFATVLLGKVRAQVKLGNIEQAEDSCLKFAAEAVNKEHKLKVLDGFACMLLYKPGSPWLKQAEKAARLGLETVPGTLTLKGTLGAILTEQNRFEEAEPMLRECLERSPAQHDQGISSVYLGIIKLRQGQTEEGKRLIRHGTTLYPQAWLVAKAGAALSR